MGAINGILMGVYAVVVFEHKIVNIFLHSSFNFMSWVLKRIVSLRWFF